jgi:hypothetical protein
MFPKNTQLQMAQFRYYLCLLKAVVGQIDHTQAQVVAPLEVQMLAAYQLLTPNVFGIARNGIILVPYNHQALLDIL